MEKKLAERLSQTIEQWVLSPTATYNISKIETSSDTLQNFHQWSNGKPIVAAYFVSKPEENGLYFLFIDWHRNDNYYLVVYSHNKSTTLAEIHHTFEKDGQLYLQWKYNPLKRDGKNAERKAYFKQAFGTTTVQIRIPMEDQNVEEFISQTFMLCSKRVKADRIVEVFSL
ncbi:hypothetical protein [Peribacillus alkalitolerans]|uniref:hypothetical protein n=1 Tax=Peribacillus alkalitolerans TaxID=1550385 RepID=UPI0013CFDBF7|nr:hypothetical protein [Peribacillus alkalitolerans]